MFLKNIIAYSSANMVGRVAVVVQAFIVRSLLPPVVMGLWNLIDVVRGFVDTFDLGVLPAAARKLPLLRGGGDHEGELEVRSTAFWSKVVQGVVFAAAVTAYTLYFWNDYDTGWRVAMLTAALMVALFSVYESFQIVHQSAQLYVPLSRVIIRYSLLYALLTVLGAYLWGIYGLIAGALVALIAQIFIIWRSAEREDLGVKKRWSFRRFKELIAFGVPLRVVDFPRSILAIADVLFITRYMGLETLAVYMTGKLFFLQAVQFPAWTTNVVIMRINNLTGSGIEREKIGKELMRVLTVTYLVVIPFIICSVVYLLALVVVRFIPEYGASIEVMTILIFAVYFVPQTSIVRNFWLLDKKMLLIGASNMIGLAAVGVAFYFFIGRMGMTMEAVAASFVVGYAVYYLFVMVVAGSGVWSLKGALYVTALCFTSAAATFAVVRFVPFQMDGGELLPLLAATFKNYLTALLLLLPLFAYGIIKSDLIAHLFPKRSGRSR